MTLSLKNGAFLASVLAGTLLISCYPVQAASITEKPFGAMPDGKKVSIFTLRNDHNVSVKIITYGGTIQSIETPDREGHVKDIVLGFGDLKHYLTDVVDGNLYFGALIGRYANRIANGRFSLNGHEYFVPQNMPPHALHGGVKGFDKKLWTVEGHHAEAGQVSLKLGLDSPDGDQGFPGNLHASVEYILDNYNNLTLHFGAKTDAETVVSLTSHSFWNLDGEGAGSIENQIIEVNADRYTPTDKTGIPTGELASVVNTPYDLRQPTRIGAHLRENYPQMNMDRGYDKNFVIKGTPYQQPRLAARVFSPQSGRQMEVITTQPGLQFYTSNGLDGTYHGISGHAYRQTDAIALETEAFPDTPNHPQFPTAVLEPGKDYNAVTIFHFSTQK